MLIINQREVVQALTMRRAIDVMRETLISLERADAVLPPRMMMPLPSEGNTFWLMPSFAGTPPALGVKVLAAFHGNLGTAFDSHQGAVLLFGDHGELVAMVDATAMTAIRTAAVSGVATSVLARDDAKVLAILGSGTQALSHLEAMLAVRPVERVCVWSRTEAHASAFATAASARFGMEVSALASVEEAVRDADIVCTTTAAHEPILRGEWLKPGVHVNAVGAGGATNRELDGAAVARSRVFVDRMDSALREAGDILLAIADGALSAGDIAGQLGAVLDGRLEGRRSADEITLFKSVGLGAEDVAAARATYDECRRMGLGLDVDFGGQRTS